MAVLNFIVNEILSKPALLVGLMSLVGLLALRKSFSDTLSGTVKTILGFLILSAGANLVITTLGPLEVMVKEAFNLHGVIPTNEAIVALALKDFATEVAAIMALGFVFNLIFALITPAKFVFLTGHHLLYMATVLAVVIGSAGIKGANLIIIGSILQGTIATIMPAFVHPFTKKITGDAGFALGHYNSLGYLVSGLIGKLVGKGSKSTEEIKVPENLAFLKEPLVITSVVMMIIYVFLAIVAGPDVLKDYTGGGNYIMYAIMQGLTFGAAIGIIIYGVRMILAELVPAFQGIAERLIPNAVPALDCPTVFPYAPNAVVIGFIFSVIGGIVGMFLVGPLGLAFIIPGMIPHFFDGGTAGVYGNSTGGLWGAIIGSFVNGLLITFLPALLLSYLGGLGLANTTFGDSDFCWAGILGGSLSRLGSVGAYISVIGVCVVLLAIASYVTTRLNQAEA
ncbi:PTS ascorbate transporter subunit IIC [Coprothermobacter platensis]|uniref:PTS ascorbate transporter subunit IIC n=1 Tax=Coprothermobacter platensis TaxID=108819 RepID=UPI0003796824|nr:PTS ascorbate transporter subunit IIC [Coprothermobacter platensis]